MLALAMMLVVSPTDAAVTLVDAGAASATIVVRPDASLPERFAADELQDSIVKATGAVLPIADAPGDGPTIAVEIDEELGTEGIALRTDGARLVVSAGGPRGIVYAAYALLEHIGFRWYWPGELGEVVPALETITIGALDISREPSFDRRHAFGGPQDGFGDLEWGMATVDWCVKNHLNFWLQTPPGDENADFVEKRGGSLTKHGSGHNWQHIIPAGTYFADHPEYFAFVRGKRIPDRQLCLTNPDVLKLLTDYALGGAKLMAEDPNVYFIDMTQNDGDGWCECEPCKALDDRDASTHADIQFWALNQIADAVKEQYPDALLHTYVYAGSANPPKWIEPADNIHCEQTNYCFNYGASFLNPNSGPGLKYKANLDAWAPLCDVRGIYEYFGFYNWLEALPVSLYRLAEETAYYKATGVDGLYSESQQRWSTNHLLYYAFARQWWDHGNDVPMMIDEFASLMFGPASEPMRAFYLALETSGGPDRYISGNEFDLPRLFGPALRDECRGHVEEAKRLAVGDVTVEARIAFVEFGWEYTERHLEAMEAHAAHRRDPTPESRTTAREAWQAYVDCCDSLAGTHAFAEGDLKRFRDKAQTQLDAYTLDLADLPAGDVAYTDQFHQGGNARLHGTVDGLYDGTWGLCLYTGGKGAATYEFGAEAGHTWSEATVAWWSSFKEGVTCVAEVSVDGETYQPLAENQILRLTDPFEITETVAGKTRFWVRLRYDSALDHEYAAVHGIKLTGRID